MTAAASTANDTATLRVDGACLMAIEGRRAGRMIAAWAKSFDLSEPELQLLWCLRQEPGDGFDQTTIAQRLAFSPAQVSAMVERLRLSGLIMQRLTVGDRRRHQWRLSGDGQAIVDQLLANVAAEFRKAAYRERSRACRGGARFLAAMTFLSGCTRSYYRRQADDEVNCIIDQQGGGRGLDARRVPHRHRSAVADVRPEQSRLPADAAGRSRSRTSSCTASTASRARRVGSTWPHTPYADNPSVGRIPAARRRGQRRARPARAPCSWRCLQSPDYQEQLETLYLSGLDVTFERFRFDTQFFGGSSIFFTADGRDRTGTGIRSSVLEVSAVAARQSAAGRKAHGHRRRAGRRLGQLADVAIRRAGRLHQQHAARLQPGAAAAARPAAAFA